MYFILKVLTKQARTNNSTSLFVLFELCIDSENQIDVNSDYLRVVVDANILITK